VGRRRRHRRGRDGSRRTIIITSASPTGQVKSSNPTIQAFVEDRYGYPLSEDDIDVYLDGQPMRFSYGRSSGRLTCPTQGLSSGTHTVEIEVYIVSNYGSRTGRKRWTFTVVRR
jgi:hypothetical protein